MSPQSLGAAGSPGSLVSRSVTPTSVSSALWVFCFLEGRLPLGVGQPPGSQLETLDFMTRA